eukprot:gb/GEZN01004621.1/.p1 GENE.gb/GEZN01004621.1/~~gb/GEZN01004621.1/.p1  ORF type:complete len:574 (+),score=76.67 gb/GEZN01004621.1/:115-1836(+)
MQEGDWAGTFDSQPGWVRSQARAFGGWLNAYLPPDKQARVNYLSQDLASGVVLHAAVSALEPVAFTAICNPPANKFKKIENFQTLLEFLKTRSLHIDLDPYTLVDPEVNLKSLLALCYQLIVRYSGPAGEVSLSPPKRDSEKKKKRKPTKKETQPQHIKDTLRAWVSKKVGQNVRNFEHDWSDGLLFCDLVHALVPGAAKTKRFKPNEKKVKANCVHAFQLAESHLGVPQLLDPDLIAEGVVDDQSVLAYVSLLQRFSQGDERCKSPTGKAPHLRPISPPPAKPVRASLTQGTPVEIVGYQRAIFSQPDFSYRVDGWKGLSVKTSCRFLTNEEQMGKSDPLVAFFERTDLTSSLIDQVPLAGDGWSIVGATEWVRDSANPDFKLSVNLFYNSNQVGDVEYKCAVYDVDKKQLLDSDLVAYAFVRLSSLISVCGTEERLTLPLFSAKDGSQTGAEVVLYGTAQNIEAPELIHELADLASQFQAKFGPSANEVEWVAALGSLSRPEICRFAHSSSLNMTPVSGDVGHLLGQVTHLFQAQQHISYGVCTAPRRLTIVQEEVARLRRDLSLVTSHEQ